MIYFNNGFSYFQGNEVSFVDSYGNVSKVVRVYEASNGVIMKLDNVLTPSVRGSEPQVCGCVHVITVCFKE